ncbi:MAG: hypothetical protein H7Y86_16650 [Rhizobacter sp.]|nr:hypothetical protein [Ferruginibacter sp.]
MQQPMDELNSLQLIESMINKAKNRFSESGTLYIIWGIVVLVCSLVQFAGTMWFNYPPVQYIWMLTWVMLIYQVFYLRKKKKSSTVKTYTDEIIGYVWICFVITLWLMSFILIMNDAGKLLLASILVIYGIPTFLSGIILHFRPLIVGGISCWLLSLSTVVIKEPYHILLISVAMLAAWIIPGVLLRNKFINENSHAR